MTPRLPAALCILLLAACTSSEPPAVTYAPVIDATAPMPPPPPAPDPAFQHQPGQPHPGGSAALAPAYQPGCRTVDNVTLCDAPADPGADDTLHTN